MCSRLRFGTPLDTVSNAQEQPGLQMMYLTARKFGFQTFNRGGPASKPDDQVEWVPASAFLAADHLCHLLITDGLPREGSLLPF